MSIRCLKDENDRLRAENKELSRTCDELHEMYGATCQCGHVMQLVRPGKYQCLACEEIAELKQSRQNISYDRTPDFESFIKDVIDLSVEKYTQADVDYLQSEIESQKVTSGMLSETIDVLFAKITAMRNCQNCKFGWSTEECILPDGECVGLSEWVWMDEEVRDE